MASNRATFHNASLELFQTVTRNAVFVHSGRTTSFTSILPYTGNVHGYCLRGANTLRDPVDGRPLLPSPPPSQTACKNLVRPTILVHISPVHATFRVLEPTERWILFDVHLSQAYLDTIRLVQP
jgi:hypothetical protein